jgi:hypothetical protein
VGPLLGQLADAEQAMAPFVSDRRMFNFLGSGADPSDAFSSETLDRLRTIKAERDPFGVIRSNRGGARQAFGASHIPPAWLTPACTPERNRPRSAGERTVRKACTPCEGSVSMLNVVDSCPVVAGGAGVIRAG